MLIDNKAAGERLTMLIRELRMNSRQFALSLEIDASYISKMEKGEKAISKKALAKINDKYKVNLEWLMFGRGNLFQSDVPQGTAGSQHSKEQKTSSVDFVPTVNDYVSLLKSHNDQLAGIVNSNLTVLQRGNNHIMETTDTILAYQKAWVEMIAEIESKGDSKRKEALLEKWDKILFSKSPAAAGIHSDAFSGR